MANEEAKTTPESREARRAELVAKQAAREKELEEREEAHRDLCLELVDKYSGDLGVRGESWDLVNELNVGGVGPIIIKEGDPTKYKKWSSSPGLAPEDVAAYVLDSVVYPERREAADIIHRKPILGLEVVTALNGLFGAKEGKLRGK
jgi:hypothetical protein